MSPEQERTESSTRTAALVVATVANFLIPFMSSSINVALPAIGAEFAADAILLSWIPTSFLLAAAVFTVPFGRIADIYGMRRVFGAGVALFTAASLLSAVATSAVWLILFRILQGIGGAMIFVTGLAIITAVYPARERGKAIGINIAVIYVALSLGPVIGGVMTHQLGWRSLFWAVVPVGLLILAVTGRKLKHDWAESRGERFDLRGSIVFGVVLIMVTYGFSILPRWPGIALVVTGIAGFAGFLAFEFRAESPVLNVRLFQNRTFAFSNLAALINYSATYAVVFLLSLYLQYVKGLDPQSSGLILVAQPAMMALFTPIAGRLSDRIVPQKLAAWGMALSTVGLSSFAFISADTPISWIVAGLMLLGVGFGIFASPNTSAIMGSVEKRSYGAASAMVSTMRLLGQMLSMGLTMMVFAIFIGSVQISPDRFPALLQSIRTVFTIGTALCFAGIFTARAR
ncbi:MAG: MFS transporter [Deltaproteobacteria bacterium]|nr:MFS transporter [Deltaproteobacteria bacterium]